MNFKHILAIILVFVLNFGVCSIAFADEKAEVPEGYTPIYTADDLNNIRNNLSDKYILMNDIDLSSYGNWEPIGSSETPFTGELDGNGYLIKNLTINREVSEARTFYYGLFGYIKNSKISNISVINSIVNVTYSGTETARCNLGTIVGCGYMSEITNCAVFGNITTSNFFTTVAGGILGRDDLLCTLNNCSNYADIVAEVSETTKYVHIGGIAGVAKSNINECCNLGDIKAEGDTVLSECQTMVGGINGKGYEVSVLTDCYNHGNISINYSISNTFAGGVSGTSFITKNTYNIGEIVLPDNFIGYSGTISGSIGIGGASLPVVGTPEPYIENVYCLESDLIVGYANCVHPNEYDEDDYSLLYKSFAKLSDENMKKRESFVGFDFDNVWVMEENGYPVLKNQPELPDNILEKPTTQPSTESTTEPDFETTTIPKTESNTDVFNNTHCVIGVLMFLWNNLKDIVIKTFQALMNIFI